MNQNYLKDDYFVTGKDLNSFEKQCRLIDDHTHFVNIDYTNNVHVLHYLQTKSARAVFLNASKSDFILENGLLDKLTIHFNYSNPEAISLLNKNGTGKNTDLIELVNEAKTNGGTVFKLENDDGRINYLFPGNTCMKTFKNMPVCHTHSSIPRDLLLAKELIDVETSLITVLRTKGENCKIISFFSDRMDPNMNFTNQQVPFISLSEAVKDSAFGNGKCIKWESSQKYTKLIYSFDDEIKRIKKDYPYIPLIPVHVLTISDSGYQSNSVASAWMDPETINNGTFIISNIFKVNKKTSYKGCLEKSIESHTKEASILNNDTRINLPIDNIDDICTYFNLAASVSSAASTIGKKTLLRVSQYARERFAKTSSCTIFDVKTLILNCFNEGLLDNVSDNVNRQLPQTIGEIIFNNNSPLYKLK